MPDLGPDGRPYISKIEQIRCEAVLGVGAESLEIMENNYGSGYPDFTPAQFAADTLAFHNRFHGYTVGRDSLKLAIAMGFSHIMQAAVIAAGESHDLLQTGTRGQDEAGTADMHVEQLQRIGTLPDRVVQMGRVAIIGTEPIFKDGKLVGQRVNEMQFASKEEETFARIVASADLGILHTPLGPFLGHQYYKEIVGHNLPDQVPPLEGLVRFQQGQTDLVTNYRYPLAQAEDVLATHRAEVVAHGELTLQKLQAGTIGTWSELEAFDKKFLAKHAA